METEKQVTITCIRCPYGCQVQVKKIDGEYQVTGEKCKQGKEYALNELTNPTRTLTTTVRTIFTDFPRLPVKTDKEIKLNDIFRCMAEINTVIVEKRLKPGDKIKTGLLDQDINLVATADME